MQPFSVTAAVALVPEKPNTSRACRLRIFFVLVVVGVVVLCLAVLAGKGYLGNLNDDNVSKQSVSNRSSSSTGTTRITSSSSSSSSSTALVPGVIVPTMFIPLQSNFTDQESGLNASIEHGSSADSAFVSCILPTGNPGTALYMSPNKPYQDLSLPLAIPATSSSFTLMFWMKSDITTWQYQELFHITPISGSTDTTNYYLQVFLENTGSNSATVHINSNVSPYTSLNTAVTQVVLSVSTWNAWSMRYNTDTTEATIFLNAQHVWTNPAGVTLPPVQGDFINLGGSLYPFVGYLRNVRFYAPTLDVDTIQLIEGGDFLPLGHPPSSSSTGSSIAALATQFNNPAILNYYYPLTSTYTDLTGRTVARYTTNGAGTNCAPSFTSVTLPTGVSSGAYYTPCTTNPNDIIAYNEQSPYNNLSPTYTLSLMFQTTSLQSSGTFHPLGSYPVGPSPIQYYIAVDFTAQFITLFHNGTTIARTSYGDLRLQCCRWIHVIATYDLLANYANIYINGQPAASTGVAGGSTLPWNSNSANRAAPSFGGETDGTFPVVGYLRQYRSMNISITGSDAQNLYTLDSLT